VIETLFAQRLDDHLNELARHYSRSPNTAKAVTYLHLAGQQATGHSTYAEAVGHFTRGLDLLRKLADNPERARHELEFQFALAKSLRFTKGLGAEETGRALIRARELCEKVGDDTELFAVLQGMAAYRQVRRSDSNAARELAEQLLALAERTNDILDLPFAVGAKVLSEALPVKTREPAQEVAPDPIFRRLNFSSADSTGVSF